MGAELKSKFVFQGTLEPRIGVLGTHVIIATYDRGGVFMGVPGSDNFEAIDKFKLSACYLLESLQLEAINRYITDGSLVLEIGEDVPEDEFQEPDRFRVRIPNPRIT